VGTVLFGKGIDGLAQSLVHSGADIVYVGDAPIFERYQPEVFTETIVGLAGEHEPQIMLLGSTFMGRELAPLIAARLGAGLTAHCIDLLIDEDQNLDARVPAYGGLISITCPEKRPQMATVARGVFPTLTLDTKRTGEVIQIPPPTEITTRVETLEIVREKPTDIQVETAKLVVAGGAGAETLEGWEKIKALAHELNAGLGSTRPAVDAGWIDISTMIGQSGKIISPEFYIGIGLSGEQQHIVGITNAKVMVAVNNDPKSPVFEQVDYGIVADLHEFIPVMLVKLNEYKKG